MMGPAVLLGSRFLYLGRDKVLTVGKGGIEDESLIGDAGKSRLTVLGKPHYFETIRSFPFTQVREIRDAVAMDLLSYSPFETPLFLMKKTDLPEGGGCRVNLWFVHPDAVAWLNHLSPMVMIPESALLALAKDESETMYQVRHPENESLWVCVGKDGLTQSMDVSGRPMDAETFARLIGGNVQRYPVHEITDRPAYMSLLHGLLMQTSFHAVWPFLFPVKSLVRLNPKHVKIGLSVAAGLSLIYVAAALALPYVAETGLLKADEEITPKVTDLLKIQQQVDVLVTRQNELNGVLQKYLPKMPLLILLNEVLPENTLIFQLLVAGNTVEIKGVTPKSTALLDALSSRPVIQNARYTVPIRQDAATGREVFTLSFLYSPAGTAAP